MTDEIAPNPRRFDLGQEGLPDLPLLMLITIEALIELGGSASVQELLEHVVEQESITEEEQSYLMPNGRTRRLNYYLAWARTYLKRGEALKNSARGVWAITETGEAIKTTDQTQGIWDRVTKEERERARQKRLAARQGDGIAKSEIENANPTEYLTDSWKDLLLSALSEMTPDGFERLAQRLLREAGFVKVEVRGKSGDGGIDGVGILRVNLVSFQVYFQCKRWSSSVGSKEIRDFRGALMGRADKGLFITTSSFTKQASEEATRDGTIAIDLIDGERLCDLLKTYDLGVTTQTVEQVTVSDSWFQEI